jgi:hypothetical protein
MNKKSELIYVAHPMTTYPDGSEIANPYVIRDNVYKGCRVGAVILEKGHIPFLPQLNYFWSEWAKDRGVVAGADFYMKWDLVILARCDSLLYAGKSKGCDIELAEAQRLGKKIYYDLDEIPDLSEEEN